MSHQSHRKARARLTRSVRKITVTTKYDIENCHREVMNLRRKLDGFPVAAAMHSKRLIAFIVQTHLTSQQLMDSLGDTTEAGCFDRVWVETAGIDVVANLPLDPLTDRVKAAYASVRKWNSPENVRPPKAGQIFIKRGVKDGERNAAVKMGFKPRAMGNRAQQPDKP